jgi:hypothetical protein
MVPNQLLRAPFPNYFKLDTESGELSWHTASDMWIPEERTLRSSGAEVGQRLTNATRFQGKV